MVKQTIETEDAPSAVGAYSQATTDGQNVYTAGQIPAEPDGELLNDAPVGEQTAQCLANLRAVLNEAGCSVTDVLKTTVYLADINDFEEMNEVYGDFFDENYPARSAVEAGNLPKGVAVEIEAVASKPE